VGGPRLELVAAGADDADFVVCGVNTGLHFITGNPFEIISIAKTQTPVRSQDATGVGSL
jgi:hypothetical protein